MHNVKESLLKHVSTISKEIQTILLLLVMVIGFIVTATSQWNTVGQTKAKVDSLSADTLNIKQEMTEVQKAVVQLTEITIKINDKADTNQRHIEMMLQQLLDER